MLVEPLGSDTLALIKLGHRRGRRRDDRAVRAGCRAARRAPRCRWRSRSITFTCSTRRPASRSAAPIGRRNLSQSVRLRRNDEDLEARARGAREPYIRGDRVCAADDAAHLHRRAAAAGRDAQDRRRVSEAQSEREGRGRGRRRDVGGAAAVSVDGAVVEGLGARRDPDRRDPPRAMGRARLGRAARRVSRRRQAEDPVASTSRLIRTRTRSAAN